jgi:hypothetical protein
MEHYVAPFTASEGRDQMSKTNAAMNRKADAAESLRLETGVCRRDCAVPHRAVPSDFIARREELGIGDRIV